MNGSAKRYGSEYLQTTGSYIEQGSEQDAREASQMARRARLRVRVTEDGLMRNILVGAAICAACLAFAVAARYMPIPGWMVKP